MKDTRPIWLFVIACLWVVISRGAFLPITFFSVDEAVSAVAADAILDGGLPYRDAIDHRGPLTYYAYAGIFSAAGRNNMFAVHFVYIGIILLSTYLVFGIGTQLHSRLLGSWAAVMFAFWGWLNPFHEMWAAHTEWLLVLASLLGIQVLLKIEHSKDGFRKKMGFLVAGLLMGIGILSKQTAVFDIAGVGLFILVISIKYRKKFFSILSHLILMGLSALIPLGITCLYFWKNGAWADFSFYVWEYNTQWYVPAVPPIIRIINAIKLVGGFFINKPLLIGCLIGAVFYWRMSKEDDRLNQTFLFGTIWSLAALTGALLGGRAFLHYLIPVLAPMSLLSAIPLTLLSSGTSNPQWLQLSWKYLVIAGLVIPISIHTWNNRLLLADDLSITEFEAFSAYIQQESRESDRIFVWGFAPELYVLSDRKPASRYSFCNMLSGHIPAATEAFANTDSLIVPGSWETLMQELDENKPIFFIDTQPNGYRGYGKYPVQHYPDMNQWLSQGYKLDTLFHQQNPSTEFHLYKRVSP